MSAHHTLACLVLTGASLLAAGSTLAAESLAYKFAEGSTLRYRSTFSSSGTMSLPDGGQHSMKFQATSVTSYTCKQRTDAGSTLQVQTVSAQVFMDGKKSPQDTPSPAARELVVAPNGSLQGESAGKSFLVELPAKALEKGEEFSVQQVPPDGGEGALRTTYTLAQVGASVPGYASPVHVFEARVELAKGTGGLPATISNGRGTLWFDPVAGLLVKSSLGYTLQQETRFEGASTAGRRTDEIQYEFGLTKSH